MPQNRTISVGILLVASTLLLRSGDWTNIRGIGMARSSVAASRGIDAVGINPANLGIQDRNNFSIVFMPFTYRASTELFTYDIYQEFFTGVPDTTGDGKREPKLLTADDKTRLLSLLPEGKGTTRMDFGAMLFGFSFMHPDLGGFALSITERMGVKLDLPKEYFRLFLFGFERDGSRYDFAGTGVSAWWWREYNVSFGRRIPMESSSFKNFYIGIGFKLVHGYGVMHTEHYAAGLANEIVGTNQYRVRGNFDFLTIRSGSDFLDPNKQAIFNPLGGAAGKGYGFDVGITTEIMSGFHFSFAVTDLGGITWDKNVVETRGDYDLTIDDPFSASGQDSLQNAIRGRNVQGESFQTSLPTILRVGTMFESKQVSFLKFLPGNMLLALDYQQGFNESLGNTTRSRFSMGMEYRIIPLLPLRTGFSLGGGDSFRWAAGFGLDLRYFNLELATENFGMLFNPDSFSMFSISFGLRIGG